MVLSRGRRNLVIPLLAVLAAILPLVGCTPGGTLREGAAVEEQAEVGERVAVGAERRISIGIASVSIIPGGNGAGLFVDLVCAGDAEVLEQWASHAASGISAYYDDFLSFRTPAGEPLQFAARKSVSGRVSPATYRNILVGVHGDATDVLQRAYFRLAEPLRLAEVEVVWLHERYELGNASEDGIAFYFHGRERPVPVMMPARFEPVRDGQK